MSTVSSGCLFFSKANFTMIKNQVAITNLSAPATSPRDPGRLTTQITFTLTEDKFVKKFDIAATIGAGINFAVFQYNPASPSVPIPISSANFISPAFLDDHTFRVTVDLDYPNVYVLGQFPVIMFDDSSLDSNVATAKIGTVPTPYPTLP